MTFAHITTADARKMALTAAVAWANEHGYIAGCKAYATSGGSVFVWNGLDRQMIECHSLREIRDVLGY